MSLDATRPATTVAADLPPQRTALDPLVTVPGLVLTALGMAWLLRPMLPVPSLSLVLLLAVLLAAVAHGVVAGVVAALLSSLAFNFFFIPPVFTFFIAEPEELFALGVFLVVATLTGSVAGRMRQQANAARRHAATVQSLFDFAATLADASSRAAVLQATGCQLAHMVRTPVVLLTPAADGLAVGGEWPDGQELLGGDMQAAALALRTGRTAPAPAGPDAEQRFAFHPLAGPVRTEAVYGLRRKAADRAEDDAGLASVLQQARLALARVHHADAAAQARAAADQEHMRNAVLSSLSHDLRTPLATILGAVTSLRQLGPAMPEAARDDLLAVIEDEAGRLSRFVTNLLDMTRVQAGALTVRRDWVEAADVCRAAAARARRVHPATRLNLDLSPDLPPLRLDAVLLEQALFNLLDNAAKHGSPPVTLSLTRDRTSLVIAVIDDGPGIPVTDQAAVFERFMTTSEPSRPRRGTGLGLAIARGMVEAMGGTLTLDSPVALGRGCRFTIRLPAGDAA